MAAATALAAIPLLRPTNLLPETDHEWAVSRQLARPLLDELGASLDELDLTGPVLIDLGAVRHVRYTLLAELQRRGIDFVFAAGSTDLSRFGHDRCDDGTARYLLTLRGGSGAVQLRGADTLLATVPGLTDGAGGPIRRAGRAIRRRPARWLGHCRHARRSTTSAETCLRCSARCSTRRGCRRAASASSSATGRGSAPSTSPTTLGAELAEWQTLERRAVEDRMAIYLRPISPGRPDLCAQVRPGDDFVVRAVA